MHYKKESGGEREQKKSKEKVKVLILNHTTNSVEISSDETKADHWKRQTVDGPPQDHNDFVEAFKHGRSHGPARKGSTTN